MFATPRNIVRRSSLLDKVSGVRFISEHRWVNSAYINKLERAVKTRKRVEMDSVSDYTSWSNEQLVARVTQLEQALKSKNAR